MSRNRAVGSPFQLLPVTESFTTDHAIDAYYVARLPVSVTLDPNAVNQDQVIIQDVTGEAGTTPIVITASPGQTVGFGSSISIDVSNGGVVLTYVATLGNWVAEFFSGDGVPGAAAFSGFETFSVPQGPATSLSISASNITVGPSGRLTWTVTFQVEAGSGTALPGDLVIGIFTLDGTPQAGLAQTSELSVTNSTTIVSVTGSVGGLTPGSVHTVGAKFTNVTNAARTIASTVGQLTGYTS